MSEKDLETQFRAALEDYEKKNYKKSLVAIDRILKKNPMHSQSYALKALVYSFYHPTNPENKDLNLLCSVSDATKKECEDLITEAIKYGPNNSISAHLIALYYRQTKSYEKACQYYTKTISNNPGNKAVLRDLASALSQIRSYTALSKIRLDYLENEPGYRQNYSSAAMSLDLLNNYDGAIKVCDEVQELIKGKLIDDDLVENSECIIYKITLFMKKGDYDSALNLIAKELNSREKFRCLDVSGLLELKYESLFKLGKFKEAQYPIRELIKRNPDNIIYYNDLITALQIEDNDDLKYRLFNKLAAFYPKSDLPAFLPLTFLKGDAFESHLKPYLAKLFQRGIPSIFSNIKSLYKKHANHPVILKIVQEFEASESNPLILTWIKYFISQHYYKLKDYETSLAKIDDAIKTTPTLIELYMFKARILKHQGKLLEAASEMNIARLMDLQDRFVNTKTVKYYLRADLIDEALETASLFTKNDDEPTGIQDLHTLQCCWFVEEYAESMTRIFKKKLNEFQTVDPTNTEANVPLLQKQIEAYLGLALQRYLSSFAIYAEYYDDQFDFHYFSFRKGTLRSYLQMIHWTDELYHQAFAGRMYSNLMAFVSYLFENEEAINKAIDLTGINNSKRSKKDKKDEIKWKEHIVAYNKVNESDPLGANLVTSIFKKHDYSKLELIEKLISRKDGEGSKPETLDFIKGEFNYEFIVGKYVVALASVRKVKALSAKNTEEGEQAKVVLEEMMNSINHFIETPASDPKIASLQKVVKLGLTRI